MRSLLTVTLLLAGPLHDATAEPIQWRPEDGGNGHWYELVLPASPAQNFTWFQARDAATAAGLSAAMFSRLKR